MSEKNCLIVGAGMTGLTAARYLKKEGWEITLLDKGRGVGGRMATRRSDYGRADHGAQFFTVRDEEFAREVAAWESAGVVRRWFTLEGQDRWMGVDGMSRVAQHLAAGLDVQTGVQVTRVLRDRGTWVVVDEGGETWEAPFLLITTPAPQALGILADSATLLPVPALQQLERIEYTMCLALLVWLEGKSRVPPPGYVKPNEGEAVSWVADNRQKGVASGPGGACLTVHASPEWSRAHWDLPKEESAALLLRKSEVWLGSPVRESLLHKWKFAMPLRSEPATCLSVRHPGPLVFAGDAFGGPRIEGAWLSGSAAARFIAHEA